MPPVDRIRELAREVGYAIGVHGTQERDLDLIAAPWTEDAAKLNYREVMQHIADGLGARLIEVEGKPLGRRACTIQMDGWYKPIDLSVCPALLAAPLAPHANCPAPADATEAAEREHMGCAHCDTGIYASRATPSPGKADAEDAARYRWLRRCRGQEHDPLFTVQHELDGTIWGGDLDAAIDAAMERDKQ